MNSSIIFRVAALHGLILALVFAQVLFSYQEVRGALLREATAVADIYYDFERYDPKTAQFMQTAIVEYAQTVVDEEWQLLAEERRGGIRRGLGPSKRSRMDRAFTSALSHLRYATARNG